MHRTTNSVTDPKRVYNPNPLKSWSKKDDGIDRFYVYILKLDNGKFYIGHTKELTARIAEHKEGQTISTAGENPKLSYFEIYPTREKAMVREHELKRLAKHNQREIYRMIWNFHDLIYEIDLS